MPPLTRTGACLRQIRNSHNAVLQFNHTAGHGLTLWKWPVSAEGERVPPSELSNYRQSHRFFGPGCICPMITPANSTFVEAAIFLVTSGPLSGQYVAACARGRCGYMVDLEQLYIKVGLPVKSYAPRGSSEPRPSPVFHMAIADPSGDENHFATPPEELQSVQNGPRSLRRSYALSDIDMNRYIPSHRVPHRHRRRSLTPLLLLLQLDSAVHPGITTSAFRSLFIRCGCGLIMTRGSFRVHHCTNDRSVERDVIEITDSDSN